MAVLAGVETVHDSVSQRGLLAGSGFTSFAEEMKVPDGVKPGFMKVWNPPDRRAVGAVHVVPLSPELTRLPLAYGFVVPLTVKAYVPADGFETGRTIRA